MDKSNEGKIILDLCGGTGGWSNPYKLMGYDVRIITLPEYDIREYEPPENVYGILAAPPCTMFSIARQTAKKPRDLREGMELVIACLNVIWETRYQNKLKFWCLENPRGILRQFLGKPVMTFQPCNYGDWWTKRTDLWGYFNKPKKKPVVLPANIKKQMDTNTRVLPELPKGYKPINETRYSARRAMTPPGFASAFYKANK